MPALVFPMIVSRLGRLPQFKRGLKAFQQGLGPVALGLMAAAAFLLARAAPGAWKGAAFVGASFALLSLTKLPPFVLIMGAGVAGAFVNW